MAKNDKWSISCKLITSDPKLTIFLTWAAMRATVPVAHLKPDSGPDSVLQRGVFEKKMTSQNNDAMVTVATQFSRNLRQWIARNHLF